jgi:hypothetical protein
MVTEELHLLRAVAAYKVADHECPDHIRGEPRILHITTVGNKIAKNTL